MILVLEPDELEHCRYLQRIGPEPLSSAFDIDYMWSVCRARARPIKNVLLDGHVVAGIGNIYASEALFRAGIRPAIRASRLSKKRVAVLVEQIKTVLRQAIGQGRHNRQRLPGLGQRGPIPTAACSLWPCGRKLHCLRRTGTQSGSCGSQ